MAKPPTASAARSNPLRALRSVRRSIVAQAITAVCTALIGAETALNALDARVGDGDTGTTFASAARAVLEAARHAPAEWPVAPRLNHAIVRPVATDGTVPLVSAELETIDA